MRKSHLRRQGLSTRPPPRDAHLRLPLFHVAASVLLACASFGIDDLAASKLGAALYGVQAIQLHTNQLVVPVLFGYLLRDQMHLATASMIEEVEKALRVTIGTFRDALSEEVRKGVKAQEVAMSEA